jgi:hypothetical protein
MQAPEYTVPYTCGDPKFRTTTQHTYTQVGRFPGVAENVLRELSMFHSLPSLTQNGERLFLMRCKNDRIHPELGLYCIMDDIVAEKLKSHTETAYR